MAVLSDLLTNESDDLAIIDVAEVIAGQPLYTKVFEAIHAASPDLVVLALDASSQAIFLGQYSLSGSEVPVVGYPELATQTRRFLAAIIYDAPLLAFGPRFALWDATLTSDGAQQLNHEFVSRFGQAMDPAAWSTYVGIKILLDAALGSGVTTVEQISAYLKEPTAFVDVYKGEATYFDAITHQLRQPLYVVKATLDANPFDRKRVDLAFVKEVLRDPTSTVPR